MIEVRSMKRAACALLMAATVAAQVPTYAAPTEPNALHRCKKKKSKVVTTKSGLKYEELRVGKGKKAEAGRKVTVHYRGKLLNGTVFDESYKRGKPFSFNLGAGEVIKGWDEGVAGMRVGGKRILTIPSNLAYGEQGAGGVIPPNATLVFEVELLKVG